VKADMIHPFRIASTDILHSVRSMSALPPKADIAEG
jgi:hypothetical protein